MSDKNGFMQKDKLENIEITTNVEQLEQEQKKSFDQGAPGGDLTQQQQKQQDFGSTIESGSISIGDEMAVKRELTGPEQVLSKVAGQGWLNSTTTEKNLVIESYLHKRNVEMIKKNAIEEAKILKSSKTIDSKGRIKDFSNFDMCAYAIESDTESACESYQNLREYVKALKNDVDTKDENNLYDINFRNAKYWAKEYYQAHKSFRFSSKGRFRQKLVISLLEHLKQMPSYIEKPEVEEDEVKTEKKTVEQTEEKVVEKKSERVENIEKASLKAKEKETEIRSLKNMTKGIANMTTDIVKLELWQQNYLTKEERDNFLRVFNEKPTTEKFERWINPSLRYVEFNGNEPKPEYKKDYEWNNNFIYSMTHEVSEEEPQVKAMRKSCIRDMHVKFAELNLTKEMFTTDYILKNYKEILKYQRWSLTIDPLRQWLDEGKEVEREMKENEPELYKKAEKQETLMAAMSSAIGMIADFIGGYDTGNLKKTTGGMPVESVDEFIMGGYEIEAEKFKEEEVTETKTKTKTSQKTTKASEKEKEKPVEKNEEFELKLQRVTDLAKAVAGHNARDNRLKDIKTDLNKVILNIQYGEPISKELLNDIVSLRSNIKDYLKVSTYEYFTGYDQDKKKDFHNGTRIDINEDLATFSEAFDDLIMNMSKEQKETIQIFYNIYRPSHTLRDQDKMLSQYDSLKDIIRLTSFKKSELLENHKE